MNRRTCNCKLLAASAYGFFWASPNRFSNSFQIPFCSSLDLWATSSDYLLTEFIYCSFCFKFFNPSINLIFLRNFIKIKLSPIFGLNRLERFCLQIYAHAKSSLFGCPRHFGFNFDLFSGAYSPCMQGMHCMPSHLAQKEYNNLNKKYVHVKY